MVASWTSADPSFRRDAIGNDGVASIHLCDDKATGADTRGAVVCKIQLAEGKAPDWVMLFPAPDAQQEIKCRDGRIYRMTNQASIVSQFNAEQHPIAFDRDHGVEKVSWGGGDGEAVGWIEELRLASSGAIEARVEWTSEGRDLIESKKYRYVSPAFTINFEVVNSVEKLSIAMPTSAGLTNRPAMVMPALTNIQPSGDKTMDKELLALLGLDEKATKEQVLEAAKAMKAKKEEEAVAAAKAKAELAAAQAAQPTLEKYVPRADFDAMKATLASFEAQRESDKATAHKQLVDTEIAQALKDGKITEGTKDFYVQSCSTAAGLESFRAFCSKAPVIAPNNIVGGGTPPTEDTASFTADEAAIAKRLGLSKEAYLAAKKD